MKKIIFILTASLLTAWSALAQIEPATVKISAEPMHDGRVSSLLFGNFIELLDDLVPGMRAEMLNNRGFEGVQRPAKWAYYDGALNTCDRDWEKYKADEDTTQPFNGARCMKFNANNLRLAYIQQGGLAADISKAYVFSGYFRATQPNSEAVVVLKTKSTTGIWTELGREHVPEIGTQWKKLSCEFHSSGTSDHAVFELQIGGFGDVWADQLSLMPKDNEFGWRSDVVEAIRHSAPSVIRWGGSVVDPGGYKWKNGIGDRDKRPPFTNTIWGRIDSNEVGIDEFCQLCRLVKAQPMICVSLADGAQSAADLVQYCNGPASTPMGAKRAANGYRGSYGVPYWQVGNEIGGDNENYLRQLPEFIQAIRGVASRANIMSSFPTQKLLTTAGKDLDFICPHQYSSDFNACDKELNRLTAMIHGTPDCKNLKIAVTEWNTSGGNWGFERGRFLTLGTALLNARYLNLLMRHSDVVEVANRSNLANSMGSGIFETRNNGVLWRPSFYVMQLYARHSSTKKVILKTGNVPDKVDLVALKMETQRRVTVFAVNPKNEPVSIKLDLSEISPQLHPGSAETVCDTLDARQPDVMNHWDSTPRVSTVPLAVNGDTVILPAFSASVIECSTAVKSENQ